MAEYTHCEETAVDIYGGKASAWLRAQSKCSPQGQMFSQSRTYMAECEVPSLTPLHGSGASGGAKRSGPTGGLAKGIPRKMWTPSLASVTWMRLPRTWPVCGLLMGLVSDES